MEVGEILNDWDPSWKVSNVDELRWLPDELKFQLTWHGKTGWRQQKITKQLNWTLKRSKSWNWSWFWSQEKWSNSPTALVVGLSSPSFWEHPALLRPEDVAPRKAEMVLEQVGYQNDTTKQWLLSWEDVLPLNPLDPFESFSSLQAATWEYWQPPPPFQVLLCPCLGCYVMSRKSLVSKHCKHCKGASTICSIVTGLCAMPWSEEAKWWRRCWESIQHLLLQLYLELSNARRRCDYPLWQRRCWDVTGDWGGNSVASKVFRFKHLIAWLQALTGS